MRRAPDRRAAHPPRRAGPPAGTPARDGQRRTDVTRWACVVEVPPPQATPAPAGPAAPATGRRRASRARRGGRPRRGSSAAAVWTTARSGTSGGVVEQREDALGRIRVDVVGRCVRGPRNRLHAQYGRKAIGSSGGDRVTVPSSTSWAPPGRKPHGAEVVGGAGDPLAVDVVHPDDEVDDAGELVGGQGVEPRGRASLARGSDELGHGRDATVPMRARRRADEEGGEPLALPPFRVGGSVCVGRPVTAGSPLAPTCVRVARPADLQTRSVGRTARLPVRGARRSRSSIGGLGQIGIRLERVHIRFSCTSGSVDGWWCPAVVRRRSRSCADGHAAACAERRPPARRAARPRRPRARGARARRRGTPGARGRSRRADLANSTSAGLSANQSSASYSRHGTASPTACASARRSMSSVRLGVVISLVTSLFPHDGVSLCGPAPPWCR
jgi:hypothetical protein